MDDSQILAELESDIAAMSKAEEDLDCSFFSAGIVQEHKAMQYIIQTFPKKIVSLLKKENEQYYLQENVVITPRGFLVNDFDIIIHHKKDVSIQRQSAILFRCINDKITGDSSLMKQLAKKIKEVGKKTREFLNNKKKDADAELAKKMEEF